MSENEVHHQWIILAQDDFKAADQLSSGGSLLLSAFHLQQCVEKYLKAYFINSKQQQPPYIHNLTQLAIYSGIDKELSQEQRDLLDELNPYYIKTRYPTFKKELALSLSKRKVSQLIVQTKGFLQWLDQRMK